MEEALTTLAMFGSIFGGVALMTYVSGRQKIALLREKRLYAEAQRPALPPAPAPADPHAAPVLALRLPEPQRTRALRLQREAVQHVRARPDHDALLDVDGFGHVGGQSSVWPVACRL